jgi:plasmid replication initiation protein
MKSKKKGYIMTKEDTTIIKSNVLLEGNHSFNLTEMKMLLSVIVQIKREDTEFHDYRVFIRDFLDQMKVKKTSYEHIRKVSKAFKVKVIEIETEKGHLITSYFSDIEVYKDHGYIDFTISPKMKKYLLQLKSSFTVYDIRNVINCKSVYSIKIYQLLKQYEDIGFRKFTLDELRKTLGLPEKGYKRWGNLKDRIIDISQKELKKFSDLYFEYTTKRKGRFIHSITFEIKKQRQQRLFDRKDQNETFIEIAPSHYQDLTEKADELKEASESGISMSEFKKTKE